MSRPEVFVDGIRYVPAARSTDAGKETFRAMITRLRKAKSLYQTDVARMAQMTNARVCYLEGGSQPSITECVKLGDVLGFNMTDVEACVRYESSWVAHHKALQA